MKNTFEGFLIAVKQRYEVSKNGVYSSFLLNPSPAQLRNFCLLLLENKLSKSDEEIFRVFFQAPEGAVLRKSIANFDIEKFKAIGNFLKGRSEKTNAVSLNLISILVDYQPRPFNKYLKSDLAVLFEEKKANDLDFQEVNSLVLETTSRSSSEEVLYNKTISIRMLAGIGLSVLLFVCFVYVLNHELYPKKECMQWENNHYEMVDCSSVKQGIASSKIVLPIDESAINLRKIEVNKQTLFFKNGKPLVWYCKNKGQLRFFNSYGIDPETEKPLKPITDYMIKKYVLK